MRRLHATENEEQRALFDWASAAAKGYPELRWMYAIPNGDLRKPGVAGRLKGCGVKPGVPDICLPVARKGHNALYIEMKAQRPGARLSPAQVEWKAALSGYGNLTVTCFGWERAVEVIKQYLTVENGHAKD